jgi:putative ABC transport system permease protein
MLSPRWRKVLMDIVGNKTRTVLVVLSIAVGIFAVGTIAGTRIVLQRDLRASYVAANPASVELYADPFDEELVQTVRAMRGISAAEGRRDVGLRLKTGENNTKTIGLTVIPDFREMTVNKGFPEAGAWPPGPREVLIERSALSMTGAAIGDTVTVVSVGGLERQLRIAGTIHYINATPGFIAGRPFGYITPQTAEWLGLGRSYSSLQFTVAEHPEDKEHLQAMAAAVREKVERSGRTVHSTFIPEPYKHPADSMIQTVLLVLGVLGLLSLVASSFLVVNTITAVLASQVRQIGMMKAIGARREQIMAMYFGMALGYGLIALALGLPLGAAGALLFSRFLAGLINFNLVSFSLPASVWLAELGVGLLVPLAAALAPVLSGSRITVLKAISDFGIDPPGARGWLDRLLDGIHFLSRPALLAVRNTFRRKGRLVLTILTLTLSGTIFVGVFSVRSSLLATMDEALAYWKADVELYFRNPYRIEEVEELALAMEGVLQVESWQELSGRRLRPDGTESGNLYLVGLPTDTAMVQPVLLEGRWLLPEDENALVINTEVTRDDPDVHVGDEITVKLENRETTWTVVGLVKGVMTGSVAYANVTYAADLALQTGRTQSIRLITDVHDTQAVQNAARRIKDAFDARGLQTSGWSTIASQRDSVATQFNLLVLFLLVMAVLLAAVGGLGLMGTMSINVLERTREIGVIRAIGASNGAVLKLFLTEGLIVGLISWALGVVIAYPFAALMSDGIGVALLRTPLTYVYSVPGALLWLALVAVISVLATLAPAWRAARLTVRDVLAYE